MSKEDRQSLGTIVMTVVIVAAAYFVILPEISSVKETVDTEITEVVEDSKDYFTPPEFR
ncbi:MAG: hypothetical protein AAB582_03905 [Patescibacteria group bacterium]